MHALVNIEYTFHYMSVNSARFMLFQKFELNLNFRLSSISDVTANTVNPHLGCG